jgi:hypothetical protein
MCTLSVLRGPWVDDLAGGELPRWRVVFNRDERRARVAGLPPVVADYGTVRASHPIDPEGGGTWLAASQAGLVFALLNEPEVPAAASGGPTVSRGRVIPALLSARSLDEVEDRLGRYRADAHLPFRLLVVGEQAVVEAGHDATGFLVSRHDASPRLVRTSSSVEPAATRRRRLALFDRLVPRPSTAAQDAFHAHRWRLALGASVLMTRPGARTVSVTVVDVFAHGFRLAYRALPAGIADVTELTRAA